MSRYYRTSKLFARVPSSNSPSDNKRISSFKAWCPPKGHTYLKKPAAESCSVFFKYE